MSPSGQSQRCHQRAAGAQSCLQGAPEETSVDRSPYSRFLRESPSVTPIVRNCPKGRRERTSSPFIHLGKPRARSISRLCSEVHMCSDVHMQQAGVQLGQAGICNRSAPSRQ
jgi:hypothetical protein